ncbi:MAG: S-adenosylmethionine synthetase N-terminal domain-containing protein, partial [Bacilli bacterium]
SILDECLKTDPESHVACEVMLSHDKVFISGEITTKASVDYVGIAKNVIEKVGYKTQDLTFESHIHNQSQDIAQAVNKADDEVGAGDQGIMFGYATNETESYMPLCVELAHKLTNRLEQCRVAKVIHGLLPDGKSQVSAEYVDGKFNRITSIIVSAQHEETKSEQELQREIRQNVVNFV